MTSPSPPSVSPETNSPATRMIFLALVAACLATGGCGYKGELVQADVAAQDAETETGDEDADAKPSAQED